MRTAFITRNIIQLVFETLKQHYPVKPLNEILDLSNGKSMTKASMSADGSIPVYGANGVIGLTHKALTLEQTITIGRVGSCGEVNLTSGQAWISDNAMWVSRIVEGIDRDYLYFALRSLPLAVSAKIAAMPSISQTNVFRESIPCPSIREQLQVAGFLKDFCQGKNVDNCAALPLFLSKLRRIVAQVEELVGKIEEARSLRQQALEETESLVKSALTSTFEKQSKKQGWELKPLNQVTEIARGKFAHRPRNEPRFYGGDIPFIQIGDISNSNRYIQQYTQTLNQDGLSISRMFPKETIVIAITGATIGVTGILTFDSCFPDSIVGIVPQHDTTIPEFVYWSLEYVKKVALAEAKQTTQPNINLQNLNRLKIPVPPLPEQRHIVAYLDNLQSKVDEMMRLREGAMKEFDALLPSILDKAFKGEL